jgi:DNA-binding GntR family transcriptional regulator
VAIERALDRFRASATRPQDVVPADYDLHLRIATASGNRFCKEALTQLGPRMILAQRAALPTGAEVTVPEHFDGHAEHEAVVAAIRTSDLTAAAAMRMHLPRRGCACVSADRPSRPSRAAARVAGGGTMSMPGLWRSSRPPPTRSGRPKAARPD